jgi:hypothetical protein
MDFIVVQIRKYPMINSRGFLISMGFIVVQIKKKKKKKKNSDIEVSQGQNNSGIKVDPVAKSMALFRIDRLSISQYTE